MSSSRWARCTPTFITCLREGYSRRLFGRDALSGLTVAVIALPLAMALGIASIPQNIADSLRETYPWLSPPAMGLYTVVIAGFLISLLGGSRVQVGGPTAAFIPIVFAICSEHGYAGLALATFMAGLILLATGLLGLGRYIKFIPYPVETGFTAGIAVTILASQAKDFLGLSILNEQGAPATVPADFIPKLAVLWANMGTINWHSAALGAGCLAALIIMQKLIPRAPRALMVMALSTAVVTVLGWHTATSVFDGVHARPVVETIGSRFGGIPSSLPAPAMPGFSWSLVREMVPSAFTIALLGAIESLLSAVVADGMTGHRHKSDQELIGQGVANIASSFFFGLPATGAIARTTANVKAGGQTPVAGLMHAVFVLIFMLAMAPLAKMVPLPALAAILVMVAANIAQVDEFRYLMRAPKSDVIVLLATFLLTVFTDLTIGVGVGVVLAALLFMKSMADASTDPRFREPEEAPADTPDPKDPAKLQQRFVPQGVEVFEINGPFFFGVADRLKDVLREMSRTPKVFILRMRHTFHIDASGMHALEEFYEKCHRHGTQLVLAGVHAQPLFEMTRIGLVDRVGLDNIFEDLDDALARAREIAASSAGAAQA
ncbi:MAG: sulfate permease [Phycisphaerales bacterium]|nr:sulfate permease [Phycisphaerales bacterium]